MQIICKNIVTSLVWHGFIHKIVIVKIAIWPTFSWQCNDLFDSCQFVSWAIPPRKVSNRFKVRFPDSILDLPCSH